MSVVVPGEYDPLLITPRWLREKDLIGAEDYDSYGIEIISSGGTVVSFGSIVLRVLPDTLQVSTDAPDDAEAVRDLAAGILLSMPRDTAGISAMGINRAVHFAVPQDAYHTVGDTLVPKGIWDGVLYLAGMVNVGLNGVREDGYDGGINVQVQPSNVVRPGVYVSINDHYTLTHTEVPTDRNFPVDPELLNPQRSADKLQVAVKILTDDFATSRNRAQAIIDRVASFRSQAG